MKKELLTIICMTLVCVSLMLGIMGLYRMTGAQYKNRLLGSGQTQSFKIRGITDII